jgi:hypothetical protein
MPNDSHECTRGWGRLPSIARGAYAVQVNRPYLNRRRPIMMMIAISVIPAHTFANNSP